MSINLAINTLKTTFTKDVIKHLKENKNDITPELLDKMRSFGNEGKRLALEILDLEKDEEMYYVDAFNNRMSFNGNRGLKKAYVKLNLYPIHIDEIKRCKNDIHYFKDNYIKIRTKEGINFPDMRIYQNDFIDTIIPDENEDIIGLMGRQSGKSVTVGIYLAHVYNFDTNKNIGIVGNKGAQAREFLNNVKNIYLELPIWLQQGTIVWNKGSIENENGMRILTDVPSGDPFRGFTIHCLIIDEAAFIRSSVWDEFTDAIFPSQSGLAWKKNIIISTANGMNHYYHMIKNARENPNSGVKVFEVDWKDVPRYKSDGSQYTNEEFMSSIVNKHGSVYFNQNYSNQFMGSSHTLITAEKLANMTPVTPDFIRDNKLNIFKFPEKNHKYIMSVDPSKDGRDAFAVQIVDITDYTFEQVASAKLQIDYLRMPEFIDEWCRYYNTAHLIIENNEGAGQSIADQLFLDYDYPNLYHDRENLKSRKNKKYPGFRTTTKTRTQILKTLKLFIENDKLKLHCKDTITEFYSFIQINNKFQADDGAMDDMIMALAIVFAPFTSARNFEDMSELIKNIYSEETEENFVDFADLMSIGSFDDYTDESVTISGTGDVLGFY